MARTDRCTHRRSHDSSPSSETKLFGIEFSDLQVSKVNSVEPWCGQLKCELFEAEYFADEDSGLVPANVATVIHFSQKKPFGVRELRQCAWQSDRTGVIETGRNCVLLLLIRCRGRFPPIRYAAIFSTRMFGRFSAAQCLRELGRLVPNKMSSSNIASELDYIGVFSLHLFWKKHADIAAIGHVFQRARTAEKRDL